MSKASKKPERTKRQPGWRSLHERLEGGRQGSHFGRPFEELPKSLHKDVKKYFPALFPWGPWDELDETQRRWRAAQVDAQKGKSSGGEFQSGFSVVYARSRLRKLRRSAANKANAARKRPSRQRLADAEWEALHRVVQNLDPGDQRSAAWALLEEEGTPSLTRGSFDRGWRQRYGK